MKINKKKFGESLKDWRLTPPKYTQEEIAEALEISQQSLCDIENGNNLPSTETILAFHVHTTFPIMDVLKKARSFE